MKNKLKSAISNNKIILVIYLLLSVAASVQSYNLNKKSFTDGGTEYNRYNNYTIFKSSFHHLKEGKDLYALYPEEHWDLYKYTPTFAVLFGVFAALPDIIGLNLWNILNALVLAFAIYSIPKISNYQKGIILLIAGLELMTSMQNDQSNALLAGLIIFCFSFLENRKYFWAALFIVLSVYIKLFGIVGFAMFLFYPQKGKLILYTAFWSLVLLALPLIFVSLGQYSELLASFGNMLSNDHSSSYGYSVMGWLNKWFGMEPNKMLVVGIGMILFLFPFYRISLYKNFNFRLLTLTSILIWMVIFNHKAESPTFIIAMAGVGIWFVQGKKDVLNIVLFICAFILTSMSPTDLFPRGLRNDFVNPYALKAVPCILIWGKIIFDMLVEKDSAIIINEQNTTLNNEQQLK